MAWNALFAINKKENEKLFLGILLLWAIIEAARKLVELQSFGLLAK